jgi:hypothetical protein
MAITIQTTPTVIVKGSAEYHLWQVRNNGAGSVSLSRDAGVTVASGFSLASGATLQVDVKEGEQLYAITGTTATVDVV